MSVEPQPHQTNLWPERLIALGKEWRNCGPKERQRNLGQIWLIINEAIASCISRDAAGNGGVEREDVYDMASEKSLDLLVRLDNGEWRFEDATPGRVSSYIATIARNALIDHLRTTGRKRHRSVDVVSMGRDELDVRSGGVVASERADTPTVRNQFVEALRACVGALPPRARALWLMRVLLGMASKDIARHPDVDMKPSAVDVALGRARARVRECIMHKGFEPHELPPGTVAALWEAFRYETNDL